MSGLLRFRSLNALAAAFAVAWLAGAAPASAQTPAQTRIIEVTPATPGSPVQAAITASITSANIGNPGPLKGLQPRLALVIGNASYQNVQKLPNPLNDAKSVSELLRSAGFEVIAGLDLTREEMTEVVQDFTARITERGPNTVALVYYAGHGLQVAGENYLVPVDAQINSEADVASNTLRLVDLMTALDQVPSRTRVVILDACRNSPFEALGEAGRGLAIVDAPNGSIVAYSTAPGTEAFDGAGDNSPYTSAFLKLARTPNLPIEQFFKRVRLLVNDVTDGRQTPWESSSLTSDFYFFTDKPGVADNYVKPKPSYAVADIRTRPARDAYRIVIEEDSILFYEEFIRIYPDDFFVERIRRLLAARLLMLAWFDAVKVNSPVAYQAFYSKYSDSIYAKPALKLQVQPKPIPVSLPAQIIRPARLLPNPVRPFPAQPAKPLPSQDTKIGPVLTPPAKDLATLPPKDVVVLPPKFDTKPDLKPESPKVTLPPKGVVVLPPKFDVKPDTRIDPPRGVTVLPPKFNDRPETKVEPPRGVVVLPPKGVTVTPTNPITRPGVKIGTRPALETPPNTVGQVQTPRARLVAKRCIVNEFGQRVCR